MSQSRTTNRSSNNSRRNRRDPTREKTYRAQPVKIQNSNSSSAAGSYAQKMQQSQTRHNASAPPRGSGPPRTSQQVQRQIPQTRQRPPVQAKPQYSQQQRPAPRPQVKFYQLQENERFGKVRRVISGDCVEVYFKEKVGDEVKETKSQINLDGIRAPKILRNARDESKYGRSDDLFGWESREALRKILAHQLVVVESSSLSPDNNGNNKMKGKAIYAKVKVRPGDMGNRPITEHDTLEDVALLSLKNGFAKVKTEVKTPNPEYVDMETNAKEAERGLWEPKPELIGRKNDKSWFRSHVRQVTFNPDPIDFFDEHKGMPLRGIVEDVTEGTRIKVEIVFNDQQGIRTVQVVVNLSGVISPTTGKKPRSRELKEPFGDFARNFTMVRMQHCDVTVYLDCIDKFNNIYGHIEFPKGDIALELIKNGCAKVVPWTAKAIGKLDEYLQMEKMARDRKIRMWGEEAFENLPVYGTRGQGVVREVTSGDSIQLLVGDELQRFYLASIQAPRRKNAKNMNGGPDPFYAEAKEYVRKNLIGKTVAFIVEYQRQNQSNVKKKGAANAAKDDPFNYVTLIYDDDRNLNEELINLGFCKAVRHKKSEPRSVGYKRLLELQKEAEIQKVGIFCSPDMLPKPETDYTINRRRNRSRNAPQEENPIFAEALEYCEENLGFVSRGERSQKRPEYKRVQAVCEFVFNGERMKIRLTEDNILCNLILADIRFEKDDEMSKEATKFCKDFISQKEIEVEIERLDRSARFIGHVFFDDGSEEMKNLAEEFLIRGWALPLKPRVGGSSKYGGAYAKALAHAKTEKLARWENYVEPEKPEPRKPQPQTGGDEEGVDGQQQQQRQNQNQGRGDRRQGGDRRQRDRGRGRGREGRGRESRDDGDRRRRTRNDPRQRGRQNNVKIEVTVIEDGVTFYAREKNSKQAERVEEAMGKINPATTDFPENWEPKRDLVCAGCYNDGKWYRCRVMSFKKDATDAKVRWIDFGETSTIDLDLLLPIQMEKGKPNIADIEPLARRCKLSGLKTPPESTPYFDEAQTYLISTIHSGTEVKFDVKQWTQSFCLVVLKVDKKEINDMMARNGFARVMRTKDNRHDEYIKHLTQLETDAKLQHAGQWEYG